MHCITDKKIQSPCRHIIINVLLFWSFFSNANSLSMNIIQNTDNVEIVRTHSYEYKLDVHFGHLSGIVNAAAIRLQFNKNSTQCKIFKLAFAREFQLEYSILGNIICKHFVFDHNNLNITLGVRHQ